MIRSRTTCRLIDAVPTAHTIKIKYQYDKGVRRINQRRILHHPSSAKVGSHLDSSVDRLRDRIQHPSWRHLPSDCSPRGAIIARHWPSPPRLRRYRRRRHPHPSASVRLPMPTLPLCATNHHLTFRLPLLLLLLLRRRRVLPILKSRPRPWCTSLAKK